MPDDPSPEVATEVAAVEATTVAATIPNSPRPLADIQTDIKKAHADHLAHTSAATDAATTAKSLIQEWDDALAAAKAEVEAIRTDVLNWFQRLGQDVTNFFKSL